MYTLYCAGHPFSGKREKKEAQRIETNYYGYGKISAMTDAQFKREANKGIECIKVHGIQK